MNDKQLLLRYICIIYHSSGIVHLLLLCGIIPSFMSQLVYISALGPWHLVLVCNKFLMWWHDVLPSLLRVYCVLVQFHAVVL